MYIYIYYIGRLAALGLGVCWFNGLGFRFQAGRMWDLGLGVLQLVGQIFFALFGFRASVSRPGALGPPTLNPPSPPLAPLGRPWAHFEHT